MAFVMGREAWDVYLLFHADHHQLHNLAKAESISFAHLASRISSAMKSSLGRDVLPEQVFGQWHDRETRAGGR